ncbi:MAG: hypothetical protein Q9210_006318 [Variospora velana]
MVELRKRREAPLDGSEHPLKRRPPAAGARPAIPSASNTGKVKAITIGQIIDLDGFGGEIATQDGQKTTLKKLVDNSKAGVVLFTYPKASTPGCTTQACLFRDRYAPLTATGHSIFGLSTDSPRSNATFKAQQKLPFTLLCDPGGTLISAIGMKKVPKGTIRGVFVVNKAGKVEANDPGGPAATVEAVQSLVEHTKVSLEGNVGSFAKTDGATKETGGGKNECQVASASISGVAAEVADTARKLDADTDV